jgi:dUTP pyrophosphatase
VDVELRRLDPSAPIPFPARAGDAGMDLCSTVDLVVTPGGGRALVPTGIAIAIPDGYAGFVLPRSGLAAKQGLTVANAPGLIDAGYRGEIIVALLNTDPIASFRVNRGDRIAQLVIAPVARVTWREVDELCPPALDHNGVGRGEGGFGHTGR